MLRETSQQRMTNTLWFYPYVESKEPTKPNKNKLTDTEHKINGAREEVGQLTLDEWKGISSKGWMAARLVLLIILWCMRLLNYSAPYLRLL